MAGSIREITATRLAGQGLLTPLADSAHGVVSRLVAVQAQDYDGARWAIHLRAPNLGEQDIEREFRDGRLIRTHVLRPTWHFVTPEDLRWTLQLTAPRVNRMMGSESRSLDLMPGVLTRAYKTIEKALGGGTHLTRRELADHLRRARIGTVTGRRAGHIMMHAELEALVCSGPRRGNQFTYALVDERVPKGRVRERDDALVTLTRTYFSTRGPATVHDCAWWSGLTIADVRRGIEIAGTSLQRVDDGGMAYWVGREVAELPRRLRTTFLLPNYDEYFIGHRDRSAIGVRLGDLRKVTGGDSLIAHVAFIDGQLVGGWKRRLEPSRAILDLEILTPLSPSERKRLVREAERYGNWVGLPLELRVQSPRSVG
jgi:hypothetical protein